MYSSSTGCVKRINFTLIDIEIIAVFSHQKEGKEEVGLWRREGR
jgi:hypothetical protein